MLAQLLQPFLTLMVAALLNDPVIPVMLAFAGIVAATVAIGRGMPIIQKRWPVDGMTRSRIRGGHNLS